MASSGTEKYTRIYLLLGKGGTLLSKRLFLKRVKQLSPSGHELTVDEFLNNNKKKLLQTKPGQNNKTRIYPPSSGTSFKDWDLHLVCFVLQEVCSLETCNKEDISNLQKMRNDLCHIPEPKLNDAVFDEMLAKIKNIFERTCRLIDDEKFAEEINNIVESFEKGPISLEEVAILNHESSRNESRYLDILNGQEKIEEKVDNQSADIRAIMEKLDKIDRKIPGLKINHEEEVEIEITNCDKEDDSRVSDLVAESFTKEKAEQFSDDEEERFTKAVKKTKENFSQRGLHLKSVKSECLLFRVKCDTLSSFIQLIRDCLDGGIVNELEDLLKAVRSMEGCENADFKPVVSEDKILFTIKNLVMNLDTLVPDEEMKSNKKLMEREGLNDHTAPPEHFGVTGVQCQQIPPVRNDNPMLNGTNATGTATNEKFESFDTLYSRVKSNSGLENTDDEKPGKEFSDSDRLYANTGEIGINQEDLEQQKQFTQDYYQQPFSRYQLESANVNTETKYLRLQKDYAKLMEQNEKLGTENAELKKHIVELEADNEQLHEENENLKMKKCAEQWNLINKDLAPLVTHLTSLSRACTKKMEEFS